MALPSTVVAWRDRGRLLTLARREVFVLDEGPRDAEAVLVLHGFPTSSYDWHLAWPDVVHGRRAVTLDLPGYGLSEKPADAAYSLLEQAEVVDLALRTLGVRRAHVVAHDMGTSVACELVAKRELGLLGFEVGSLLLMNGSVHLELARLTLSQKLLRSRVGDIVARASRRSVFQAQMRRIVARPLAQDELDAMWALLCHRDGLLRLPRIISYLDERERFRARWIGALTRLDVPTHILWGTVDRHRGAAAARDSERHHRLAARPRPLPAAGGSDRDRRCDRPLARRRDGRGGRPTVA